MIQGFHRWCVRGDCPPNCGLLGRIHRMIPGSVERKRIGQTNASPPYTFQSSGRGFLPVIDLAENDFHAFVPQPSQKLAVLFVLFASILPCVSDLIATARSSSIHFVVSVIVNSCSSIDSTEGWEELDGLEADFGSSKFSSAHEHAFVEGYAAIDLGTRCEAVLLADLERN